MQTHNGKGETRLRLVYLLLPLGALFVPSASAQQTTRRLITRCWQDIERLDMGGGYEPDVALGTDGISLHLDPKQAKFSVRRGARTIFTFAVDNLSSNAEVLWSPDGKAFALNYSDGGAIGGFHVRLFLVNGDKVTDVSRAIQPAVNAFKARHYCKSRGNNVMAVKWLPNASDLLLMTEVYSTGDCGPDLGYAEGYIVAVPDGKIERHLTLNQLKNLPGICLENEEH
jgi:hypothetical protein